MVGTRLARALTEHTIHTAQSRGWDTLSNGALLNAAEASGFEVLVTTHRRIRHQQNLKARRIALVVLTGSTSCATPTTWTTGEVGLYASGSRESGASHINVRQLEPNGEVAETLTLRQMA